MRRDIPITLLLPLKPSLEAGWLNLVLAIERLPENECSIKLELQSATKPMAERSHYSDAETIPSWTPTQLEGGVQEDLAVKLLKHYGFDLYDQTAEQLVTQLMSRYPSRWIRSAVIEALYQGRYKDVSVKQLLSLWQRRGQPLCHFNHEFERMVCTDFLQGTSLQSVISVAAVPQRSSLTASSSVSSPAPVKTVSLPLPEKATQLSTPLEPVNAPRENEIQTVIPPAEELLCIEASPPLTSELTAAPEAVPEPMTPSPVAPALEMETTEMELEAIAAMTVARPLQATETEASELPTGQPPALLEARLHQRENGENRLASQPAIEAQPEVRTMFKPSYPAAWSRKQVTKYPIHQFIPVVEVSEFYTRLKAVAEAVKGADE